MAITTEQWSEIKAALSGTFGRAVFNYKGHRIAVSVEQDGRKLVLAAYINGEIRGAWQETANEMNPIITQVWYPKEVQAYTAKVKKELKGLLSKKELNKKVVFMSPWFPSPSSLLRQYKKLDGLELVEVM